MGSELLSSQDASSSNCLDLLFSLAGEEASLHDDWLLGESSLAKNLNNKAIMNYKRTLAQNVSERLSMQRL